jgi:hypothetical protein
VTGRGFATFVVSALAVGLPACSSSAPGDGLNNVSQLVGAIERVHTATELAQERVHVAVRELQTLMVFDFKGDPVKAYAAFAAAVEESSRQVEEMRQSVVTTRELSEPVFTRWAEDLDQFKSMEMRLKSQARLKETRERYDAVVQAAELAQAGYDSFNAKLCDYSTFLGHDFNAASVAAIKTDVRALSQMVDGLDTRFDACQEAARVYIDAAALPTTAPQSSEPAPKKGVAPAKTSPTKRVSRRDG